MLDKFADHPGMSALMAVFDMKIAQATSVRAGRALAELSEEDFIKSAHPIATLLSQASALNILAANALHTALPGEENSELRGILRELLQDMFGEIADNGVAEIIRRGREIVDGE